MFPNNLMMNLRNSNSNATSDQKPSAITRTISLSYTNPITTLPLLGTMDDSEYSDPDFEEEEENDEDSDHMFDFDRANINKPWKVAKYADKIFEIDQNDLSLKEVTAEKINSFYTNSIEDIRKNVLTWIIYIAQDYSMLSNTWYQAIEYFDCFLAATKIPRKEMHVAGLTCLWMSAKMEERSIPKLKDIASYIDSSIPTDLFVQYEKKILQAIDFQLSPPTPKLFLRRYLEVISAEENVIKVANFFCELSLWELAFREFHPDILALASVALGKVCCNEYCPIDRLITYSHNRDLETVKEICRQLLIVATEISNNPKNIILQRYFDDTEEGSIKNIDLSLSLVNDLKSFK